MKKSAKWIMSAASAAAIVASFNVGAQHVIADTALNSPTAVVASNNQSTTNDTATTSSSAPQTITGTSVQTPYGPVQVAVTVENGQLTSAEAVDYPNSDGHSQRINSRAIPQLNSAASANGTVDSISGATYTTSAYKKSLQSALDQAGL